MDSPKRIPPQSSWQTPGATGGADRLASASRFRSRRVAEDGDTSDRERPPGSRRRLLIVGTGEEGWDLVRDLEEHFPTDYEVVGFAEDVPSEEIPFGARVLGGRQELPYLVQRYRIDEVLFADVWGEALQASEDRWTAPTHRGETGNGACSWEAIDPLPETETAISPLSQVAKRSFDVVFSLGVLAVGAPVLAVAVLAVKLTSPGPIVYSQERVGRGGRVFRIYKLRTMVDGAERKTGPILASQSDPRTTPVGRILRGTKLDEWPQFFNVLRGDMSVVGPRPERPCFVEGFSRQIPSYSRRHDVRPGITGLAQVVGGYRLHVWVKLRYDLIYIRNVSLWHDLRIIARTPLAILQGLKPKNGG